MTQSTVELLGTPLLVTNYGQLIARCHELARGDHTQAIDFTNTHIVTLRRHDPRFREITSCFDYFIPDGMPLVWCLNARGAGMTDRVYGPTFMRRCLEASLPPWKHYFLGGSSECLEALKNRFSQCHIVGTHHGYFMPNEERTINDEINRLAPDFIWVGLGTPKQQEWIQSNKLEISRGVILAVGFAFDVNAGSKKDALAWMQRCGLTWLFRLLSEPRRLFSRYLRYNSLFLYYLIRDALSGPR